MRHLALTILTFVISALLTTWVMTSALTSGFARFGVPDSRFLFGTLSTTTAIALGTGLVVFVGLVRNARVMTFTDEVIDQLSRVTWPTREETVRASGTVVLTTLFTAGLLSAFDFLWKNVADYFLFAGS